MKNGALSVLRFCLLPFFSPTNVVCLFNCNCMSYCADLFRFTRRASSEVRIGNLLMGSSHPVRLQSMTNTSTMDTEGSVAQCLRIVEAGADLVRLTAQGEREAANLATIKQGLLDSGCTVPLVADIHFNPKAADEAALHVDKVRINPGNYVDPVKTFTTFEYSDEEYAGELTKIRNRFVPFLRLCKEKGTAIRIGVNHGSLSDRIMSRYGDTPAGMVESCLEFLRLCVEERFSDVVISIKASNTLVMVQTVRLLVDRMNREGMAFPLHLGVTEAGDGEDGRVKSTIGIGTLLLDGIGDTIRVSLSEDPEAEIPVAKRLVELVNKRTALAGDTLSPSSDTVKPHVGFDPFSYNRRKTVAVGPFGGGQVPTVLLDSHFSMATPLSADRKPDFMIRREGFLGDGLPSLVNLAAYKGQPDTYPMGPLAEIEALLATKASMIFVKWNGLLDQQFDLLPQKEDLPLVILLDVSTLQAARAAFHQLMNIGCHYPVVLCTQANYSSLDDARIGVSLDLGPLLLDGFGDGVLLSAPQSAAYMPTMDEAAAVLFSILQATRLRISKTEYISCPGCGRTLFNLQQTIARIKAQTGHLKGLKIGIMGCIVNGPGEMADADYGYVGAGRGKVSLYKGQQCIERNIPEADAVGKLIELIKANGDWQ